MASREKGTDDASEPWEKSSSSNALQSDPQLSNNPLLAATPATAITTKVVAASDRPPGREAPLPAKLTGAGVAGQMHSESSGRSLYVMGTQQGHSTRASVPPDYVMMGQFDGVPISQEARRTSARTGSGATGAAAGQHEWEN